MSLHSSNHTRFWIKCTVLFGSWYNLLPRKPILLPHYLFLNMQKLSNLMYNGQHGGGGGGVYCPIILERWESTRL